MPGAYDKLDLRVQGISVAGWRICLEFERWLAALKWQLLEPCRNFASMIEHH